MDGKRYIADFETSVYKNQKQTEVWAAAIVEENTEDVKIYNSIKKFFDYIFSKNEDMIIYFHNLKFDGTFLLQYLKGELGYSEKLEEIDDPYIPNRKSCHFVDLKEMENDNIKYVITDMGQWYSITIKHNGYIIEFRDSLKLLPISVRDMGKAFKTKHQKLNIEYVGKRKENEEITKEEKEYIANDVLVVKEALEYMWKEGHDKLSIGACCLSDYKKLFKEAEKEKRSKLTFDKLFPNLSKYTLDDGIHSQIYNANNADEYIRKSYRGGWCYVNKYKQGEILGGGCTYDVNSLYPSMMHSDSGNMYPVGKPKFWTGDIPQYVLDNEYYYFVRIRTRFYLKPGKLPFITIKNNIIYDPKEMLEKSDIWSKEYKCYCDKIKDANGNIKPATVELTLSKTDWELMQEHYVLKDLEILDGCWFLTTKGLFDSYINKWAEVKKNSKGAMRQIAKLFLNNLYGKMASSTKSNFKLARIDENGVLRFTAYNANDKTAGYIPVGAAITSYARAFTIRAAQANYACDLPGFVYADTDSIHCDLPADKINGVKVHDTNFNCWKLEDEWTRGKFVRPKTYIEEEANGDYNIKCSGMPEKSKEIFSNWLKSGKATLDDYDIGLIVPGCLKAKQIKGGTVLEERDYTMQERTKL